MSAVDDIAAYLAHLKTGGNRIERVFFDELPKEWKMNAMNELHRLLDERGIEYTVVPENAYSREYIKIGSMEILTNDNDDIAVHYLTPEQAVDAALGRETCHFKWSLADNGWADHTCSECGYRENTDIHVSLGWSYCPNCGRKVVDA